MGARETPFFDWAKQREALRPYVDGKGGVVGISVPHDGLYLPFNNAVSCELQAHGVLVIQVNCDDTTYSLSDLLSLLEERLALEPTNEDPSPTVQVLSGLKAEGDITIRDVDINVHIDAPQELRDAWQGRGLGRRCRSLIEHLTSRNDRLCLMFLRSDRHKDRLLGDFRQRLWDAGLAALASTRGLLVIDSHARDAAWHVAGWPLPRTCELALHEHYDRDARHVAAEDLAPYLVELGIESSVDSARVRARGWLDNLSGPAELYARLPGLRISAKDWEA